MKSIVAAVAFGIAALMSAGAIASERVTESEVIGVESLGLLLDTPRSPIADIYDNGNKQA